MPHIKFTSALKRFFPSLADTTVEAATVMEVIDKIEGKYPGISTYLVDDNKKLRQHVNVFVRGELIRDRDTLLDAVESGDEVLIFQALSGG